MGRGEKAKRLANPDSKMAEQVMAVFLEMFRPVHEAVKTKKIICLLTLTLSLLFLPITPRSRSTLVPIIPLSRFSPAREFPYPHLALGKPAEEAVPNQSCGS